MTEPRRPGKPRLREGQATARLSVPIAASDLDVLRRAAEAAGESLSAYVRRAALERAGHPAE